MSKATYQALDEAIRAHVMDEMGGPLVVTDFVVQVAAQTLDDNVTHYHYSTREGMPWHVLIGLERWFLNAHERGDDGDGGDDE